MGRRAKLVGLTLLAAPCVLAAFAAACFPDYEISTSGSPDGSTVGNDGGPISGDGAPATGDGNAPPRDGSAPPGDAPTPPADGSTPVDGSLPFDAGVPPVPQVLVPAGTFAYRNPSDTTTTMATLTHAFYLDQTELPVGVLRAWVAAQKPVPCTGSTPCTLDPGGPYAQTMQWDPKWNTYASDALYKDPNGNCSGISEPFDTQQPTYLYADDRIPATCINWYIAAALCWFDGGKRLPTQVEWQYEATGRGAGRTYAWGDTPTPSDCTLTIWSNGNTSNYNGCNFPLGVPAVDGGGGASLDGVFDMTGDVFEWTWDWYDSSYPSSWPPDYAGLPADAGTVLQKDLRGGGWASSLNDLPALHGYLIDDSPNGTPTAAYNDTGVRCAKTKP
jgi:formylglycine-generating enzyme required for sulfatase activity